MREFLRGPYFKVYGNILNNPKLAKIDPASKWTWIELMAVAATHCGFTGEDCHIPFDLESLAWYMRRSDSEELSRQLKALELAKLLKLTDRGIELHEWEFWQAPTSKAEHNENSNQKRAVRRHLKQSEESVKQIEERLKPSEVLVKNSCSKKDSSEQSNAEQCIARSARSVEAAPPTGGLLAAKAPRAEPEHLRLARERSEREGAQQQAEWAAKKAAEAALKPAVAPKPAIVIPVKTTETIRVMYEQLRAMGQLTAEQRLEMDKAEKRELARLTQ